MDSLAQETIIIIGAALFFLLLAISIIILFLVYQKRQMQFIIERKELNIQFQNELLKTRLEAQEETFMKLSKDLHDNIGQLLSSSKMLIGVAERSMLSSPATLQLADETLSKAIYELRSMNKSLNKEWLEKFSLIENLQTEIAHINATHQTKIILDYPDKITLSGDRQLLLFRIVQEVFQNAIKQGNSSLIKINLSELKSTLTLTIKDNGTGLDAGDTARVDIGKTNIAHRTEVMGGCVQWLSNENGTLVEIELPLYENKS